MSTALTVRGTGELLDTSEALRTWPSGLWKLLTDGEGNAAGAARLIAINPVLKAQLTERLAVLEESKRPATPEQVMVSLMKNKAVFGMGEHPPEFWASLFEPYLEVLSDMPLLALEAGWRRWHSGEVFPKTPEVHRYFPRPAELVKACEETKLLLGKARNRARLALEHVEKAPAPAPSAEERAQVEAQMRAEGFLSEDGKFRLPARVKTADPARPAGETPQQMAERLRRIAEQDPAASEDVI